MWHITATTGRTATVHHAEHTVDGRLERDDRSNSPVQQTRRRQTTRQRRQSDYSGKAGRAMDHRHHSSDDKLTSKARRKLYRSGTLAHSVDYGSHDSDTPSNPRTRQWQMVEQSSTAQHSFLRPHTDRQRATPDWPVRNGKARWRPRTTRRRVAVRQTDYQLTTTLHSIILAISVVQHRLSLYSSSVYWKNVFLLYVLQPTKARARFTRSQTREQLRTWVM